MNGPMAGHLESTIEFGPSFLPTTNIHPTFTNIAPGKTCRLPAMTLEISGRLLMDLALPPVSPMSLMSRTKQSHETRKVEKQLD